MNQNLIDKKEQIKYMLEEINDIKLIDIILVLMINKK